MCFVNFSIGNMIPAKITTILQEQWLHCMRKSIIII